LSESLAKRTQFEIALLVQREESEYQQTWIFRTGPKQKNEKTMPRRTNNNQDPESHQQTPSSSAAIVNPYSSGQPPVLPALHPVNILKRGLYISIACYGLHKLKVPKTIMISPNIRHEWFKVGLAGSIAIMGLKAYVEMYAGKLQKKKVNYENFKQTTHAAIALLLLTSFAFHVALWPHYGTNTFVVMFLLGVVLLQTALLLPVYLQNIVSVVFMTFFLQEYK
jgi:hypothetical protein